MEKSRHLSLDSFPAEILLQIANHLSTPSDRAHLAICCRRFEALFLQGLYRHDVQCWNSSALLWACRTGSIVAAQRSLEAGASVNHAFFGEMGQPRRGRLTWPVSQARTMMSTPTPRRPLSVAVHARQRELVAFLLAQGADASMCDTSRAAYHNKIWFPIHWAVSCGSWSGGCFFRRPPCDPVPADEDIVALLLKHGADPNQPTIVDPRTGPVYATHSHASNEAAYALHMSLCEHVPVTVVRLLLEAGADPLLTAKEFGCEGRYLRGRRTSFRVLDPKSNLKSEERDGKMILLAQRTGETRGWKFDDDSVPRLMARLTPIRMQLLQMMVEAEPQLGVSGVLPLLTVWTRQKTAVLQARGQDDKASQSQILQSLEGIIAKLLGIPPITYVDKDALSQTEQVDLVQAFSAFCQSSQDGNTEDFVKLLEAHDMRCY